MAGRLANSEPVWLLAPDGPGHRKATARRNVARCGRHLAGAKETTLIATVKYRIPLCHQCFPEVARPGGVLS